LFGNQIKRSHLRGGGSGGTPEKSAPPTGPQTHHDPSKQGDEERVDVSGRQGAWERVSAGTKINHTKKRGGASEQKGGARSRDRGFTRYSEP